MLPNGISESAKDLLKAIPDWFYWFFHPLWWILHPKISPGLVIPIKEGWFVKRRGMRFCVPTFQHMGIDWKEYMQNLLNKYTLKSFIEVKRGDTVVDVGAFIGGFSSSVGKIVGTIVAIEPDPRNFACLKRNLENLENAIILRKLLWKEKCEKELKFGFAASDSSVINIDGLPRKESIVMRTSTLDDVLSSLGIEYIDFLKIDAEGAEVEVLKGAREILDKTRKISVDASLERWGKSPTQEIINILRAKGFNIKTRGYWVYARKE